MHLPRLLPLSTLGLFVFAAMGCNSAPRVERAAVSKVFVRDVSASTLHVTSLLGNAVHDAEVRALTAQGYTVVTNEGEAEATLRSSWKTQRTASNRADDYDVSLSISLFDKGNHRLFDGNSGPGVSVNFWNEGKATAEASAILKQLPAPAKK